MFESEFLTSSNQSKEAYRQAIAQTVNSLCDLWPQHPFSGRNASALAELVPTNFLPEHGSSIEDIVPILRHVIANSIVVSHPATTAHLHCPPLVASLAAEVVISALNQSMDSFDQAPIATVVEQKIIGWLCREARLPPNSGGTFTTGGSQSNYMGLLLARDAFLQRRWNWSAQKDGLPSDAHKLRILCSEVAHFTVKKSAAQLGLGTNAVVRVGVDDHFRMAPSALGQTLDQLRGQRLLPMAVVATAGTTDFGSIDPLHEIAGLARSPAHGSTSMPLMAARCCFLPGIATSSQASIWPIPLPSTSTNSSGSRFPQAFSCSAMLAISTPWKCMPTT